MAGWDWNQYAVGGATRPDSFSGMDPAFAGALQQLFAGAPADVQRQLRVGSGYRSIARQQQLWDASDKSGKMVARPGGSQHNHGRAADLKFLDPAARAYVHANAKQYGLNFPMSYEPWHVELAGARGMKPGQGGTAVASAAPTSAAGAMTSGAPTAAPQLFGDLVAPTPVQTQSIPAGFGEIAASLLQASSAQKQAQAEQEAADAQRKAALFADPGGLWGIYS